MRKINTRFFFLLLGSLLLLAGAIFGLHRLQASNIADALLWQAHQAEKEGKLDRAAKFLSRYLEFAREDLEKREHLGMILSDPLLATSPQRRARARFVIDQVLAKDPARHLLRQRACQMAINERLFEVAREHLHYLEKNQPESMDVPYLLGQWHAAQNQLAPAATHYRRALQMNPVKAEAYVQLVGVLTQLDFGREARHADEIDQLVLKALEKAPRDPGVLSLAAQHALARGDTRIALNYLEDGLQQNPEDARLYLALARVHSKNDQRSEAIAKLQFGLQKVRKDHQYDLRWNLSNLLLDENRLEEAKKVIAELRELNPLSADYLEARAQMRRGRWFEAAQQLERVRPGFKSAKELAVQIDLYLGACYEQLEEPVLQQMAFQRAANADPGSLLARKGLASACWSLGQTGEAMQIYQELVTRTKNPLEAAQHRLEYVRMLLQSSQARQPRDWKKIEADLNEMEKTLLKSLDIALLRADLAFLQGNKDRAEALMQEAIKEHQDRHEPWLALIAFTNSKGEVDHARQLMKTAETRFRGKAAFRLAQIRFWMEHRPTDAVAELQRLEPEIPRFTPQEQASLWQSMAEAYYFSNQYDRSACMFQRIAQLPLHAQDIRVRMQWLEVLLLQQDDRQARAVLDDIKRIEGTDSASADWSFGEALRLMREGRQGKKESFEQARHLLTVAASQRPNWHPIIQARAELDELQGRFDQAMANYRQAMDLGSRDPQVMKQLMQLLSQAHRFDEVEDIIARMQKLYGTTDDVIKGFVHNAFSRKDYQKAEFLAKQLVTRNSKNFRDHLWLGRVLSIGSKGSDDAEQAFRRAVALSPQQPESWIGLVRYLTSVGKGDVARSEIENIKKFTSKEWRDLTLAQCHELMGAMGSAEECYKAVLRDQPGSVLAHRAAADFYLRMGLPVLAEPLYRKIVERKISGNAGDVLSARNGLALALVKLLQPASTAEALRLVGLQLDESGNVPVSSIADSMQEQLIQAKVLGSIAHERLRNLSIRMLESLQQKNILMADDQYLLVSLLSQQGSDAVSWRKLRLLLHTLLLDHPKSPRFLAFAAHLFMQQKEFQDAEQHITRLENLELENKTAPGKFGSIELRARMLELRGMGAQAVVLLTHYAEEAEAPAGRKLLLASLEGRLGHYQQAIDLCESVRQTGSSNYPAIATALAILRQNQPSEAQPSKHEQWQQQRKRFETILREALQRDPKNVSLRLQLADMMELQCKYQEVETICRDVLRDDATNLVALNNLAWLLAQQNGKTDEALKLIHRAIEKHGPRPELLDTRAVVALNMGQFEASIRDLERVVKEAPTPARLFHLSRAYDRANNRASSLAMLHQANEMGLTLSQMHPMEHPEYQRVMADMSKLP